MTAALAAGGVLLAGQTQPPTQPQYAPNEVLIQFEPGVSAADKLQVRGTVGGVLRRIVEWDNDGALELVRTQVDVANAVALLGGQSGVQFAEPNWLLSHQAVSNDPFVTSGRMWGLYGLFTSPLNQYGVGALEIWAAGQIGSSGVYVAVIDEGIDYTHPDLAANIWNNPFDPVDGIDNDGNGYTDDLRGWDFYHKDNSIKDPNEDSHGTHVAGTIGAIGGNGIGVAGVAWDVKIISAKFLGPGGGYISDAVAAVNYITDLKTRHGLRIVATNNSWGGGGYSQALHDAIIRGANAGILFIAAAGNNSANSDITPQYPASYDTTVGTTSEAAASYDGVIAVAAISSSGAMAGFSNYGVGTVDIGAPGVAVTSTLPGNLYGGDGIGGGVIYSGTSMAAPHVSGAAVLLASMYGGITAETIKNTILLRAVPTPSLSGLTSTGGRLSVVDWDLPPLPPGPPPPLPAVSVADLSATEGNGGTSTANLIVSLSAAYNKVVRVNYATAAGSAVGSAAYVNPSPMTIPVGGIASPYPSTITVPAGAVSGTVSAVTVRLTGFSHTWPGDVDILLVGPGGQSVVLMSDVGSSFDANSVNLAFDDAGPPFVSGALASGTYRPTNFNDYDGSDTYPAPAPVPGGSWLSAFNGVNPVGTWRLYVVDDVYADAGTIAGWSLSFTTSTPAHDFATTSGTLVFPPGTTTQTAAVALVPDGRNEPDETFSVVLSAPVNATIADGTGLVTIVDDDVDRVTLAADKTAPQAAGTSITVTATPLGGAGPFEYRWWIFDGIDFRGGNWGSSPTFTWTPIQPYSGYRVAAWVRSVGHTEIDVYEATDAIAFPITAALPLEVTFGSTLGAPQPPGKPVTFAATAVGGLAPYQFKWWLFNGTNWLPASGWGGALFTWTAATANPDYRVGVWARNAGGTVDTYDAVWTQAFPIVAPPAPPPPPPPAGLQLTGLTANRTAPQPTGTTITFTATSAGGTGPHQYKWFVFDTDWRVQGGWTTSSTLTWTPATALAAYRIGVWVRSAGSIVDSHENGANGTIPFAITAGSSPPPPAPPAGLTLTSLTASRVAPQPVGTTITFTAASSGGTGPHQYKWFVFDTDWRVQGDWTTIPVFSWTPATALAGYRIGVWVRSAGSTIDSHENGANGTIAFPIVGGGGSPPLPPPLSVVLTANLTPPQPPLTNVYFTATVTGGTGPFEYKWWVWRDGNWFEHTYWGGVPTLGYSQSFPEPELKIAVWVRRFGVTTDTYEAVASIPFPTQ